MNSFTLSFMNVDHGESANIPAPGIVGGWLAGVTAGLHADDVVRVDSAPSNDIYQAPGAAAAIPSITVSVTTSFNKAALRELILSRIDRDANWKNRMSIIIEG